MPEFELWTLPNCSRCEEAKTVLRASGFSYTERPMEALRKGEILDVEAMAEAVMSDGIAPLIRLNGRFIKHDHLLAMLTGAE